MNNQDNHNSHQNHQAGTPMQNNQSEPNSPQRGYNNAYQNQYGDQQRGQGGNNQGYGNGPRYGDQDRRGPGGPRQGGGHGGPGQRGNQGGQRGGGYGSGNDRGGYGGGRPPGRPSGRPTGRPGGRPPQFQPRGHDRNEQQENTGATIDIIHLDEHIMVIKKPVGPMTAAVHSRQATALDLARNELRTRRERNLRVFPIHEIDRDASGILVFARTDEATEALRRQFRSRGADRIYLALIEADLDAQNTQPSTIRSRLIENARGVAESVPDYDAAPTGPNKPRAAVTHVRTVASRDGLTLVRLRAETDHPYQLRAHMSECGTPIAGDRAYRSRRDDIPRLALHLAEVSFEHPVTNAKVHYTSPAPAPFYDLVGKPAPKGSAPAKSVDAEGNSKPTHWDTVSEWYDDMIGGKGNDLYDQVLIPRTLDLMGETHGRTILDIACGQGVLSRALAQRGSRVVGIDAAAGLIERARQLGDADGKITYAEGDAKALAPAIAAAFGEDAADNAEQFDAAVSLMALMNIDDLDAAMKSAARALKPGGSFVGVILHPAFRAPRQSSWGWMGPTASTQRQFRRVDSYLSESAIEITMNPGAASSGEDKITTTTFNRPISSYVRALADAGFALTALEEWISPRESQPGPRAEEENRARQEFPMFLAFRAERVGVTEGNATPADHEDEEREPVGA